MYLGQLAKKQRTFGVGVRHISHAAARHSLRYVHASHAHCSSAPCVCLADLCA
jgi:hypothetical protein